MQKTQSRLLSGIPSVYLDTLRIAAALTVVLVHGQILLYHNADPLHVGYDISHAAVIVFFALSGFVIAHTTSTNNRGQKQYAQARLSRLYSVVLPALVLTALIQGFVHAVNPELSSEFSRGASWPRYILSATFTNELWWISAGPMINGVVWSLSYEFWYYVIFGLWIYRSGKWGILFPLLACIVAGPKILLLMPIWVAGCLAYRLPRPSIPNWLAWALMAVSLGLGFLCLHLPVYPVKSGTPPLFYSSQFISDWLIGFFIALTLWLLPQGDQQAKQSTFVNGVRTIGDVTFPLYMLHVPLIVLMIALFGRSINYVLLITTVITTAALLGLFLDNQRKHWVSFFKWVINELATGLNTTKLRILSKI
ncbi:acyltransferase [Spirosoma sp. KNUC1025]|uniref:acyltransferase family protein n=1 Tax=Spirosoma sp. KNUC1025 TaxID=2894082 RepID=UPI0038692BC7|nr:acyltransferase [Spirosoma sp. KNUC1025]